MGFKAMIHTLTAKAHVFPITSVGSLFDETFTGVVYLKESGITTDFRSLKGKKIGYVGEFGKVCSTLYRTRRYIFRKSQELTGLVL